jgi:tRNA nucleotidyltransferase/poly(A) polymerase
MEDALAKDVTINCFYLNLKTMIIEDPLNAIEDLREGILKSPLIDTPLKKDFFRVFRFVRISAQNSFRISPFILDFIYDHKQEIKVNNHDKFLFLSRTFLFLIRLTL